MQRQLRILMLAPPPHLRGPCPKHTPHLVSALTAAGCEVILEHWGRHNDVESPMEKILGRLQDVLRIRGALRRLRPDVLYVKTSHDWNTVIRDVLLLIATRTTRPGTILQLHGSQPDTLLGPGNRLFKVLSGWIVRAADAVLVLSSEECREWQTFCPSGRFITVSNAFRPPQLTQTSSDVGARDRDPNDVPVLLFVGRLIPEKGIFDLLAAVHEVRRVVPCRLVVAGDGDGAGRVMARVRELDLTGLVTLAGYLEGEELDRVYREASIFVLPTWWKEGFPTVISEAMNAGLPIVTTRSRGMADHLAEGVNALFVPPRDPGALAETLEGLLNDDAARARMGAANREAIRKFAPEIVVDAYLRVLQTVCATRVIDLPT